MPGASGTTSNIMSPTRWAGGTESLNVPGAYTGGPEGSGRRRPASTPSVSRRIDRSDAAELRPAGPWTMIQPDRVTIGAVTASALIERFMHTPSLVEAEDGRGI